MCHEWKHNFYNEGVVGHAQIWSLRCHVFPIGYYEWLGFKVFMNENVADRRIAELSKYGIHSSIRWEGRSA